MLQWHCLVCSIAIYCCSTSVTVALSGMQYSDRLLFYWCYSGTVWCAVQRSIAVLPVLKWHCLLCSKAIDCCSTGATVALYGVQYSDRFLFYCCYSGTLCCAVQRSIAFLPVLQWHYLLCIIAIYCCSTGATVALSAVQ